MLVEKLNKKVEIISGEKALCEPVGVTDMAISESHPEELAELRATWAGRDPEL